ncbi:hypothetical protein HYFRA_00003570 [Hymenoscyphus fraxineus]|uniref:Uncharacterized protein n=1 Tax=Hymenoscyphus fraxineus TaxID=746836 RepID=A0A9N9PHQ1_9HELO|nr:hypothetical protein HYFRA_00003570 [Hymenoscyphus fraxineus]
MGKDKVYYQTQWQNNSVEAVRNQLKKYNVSYSRRDNIPTLVGKVLCEEYKRRIAAYEAELLGDSSDPHCRGRFARMNSDKEFVLDHFDILSNTTIRFSDSQKKAFDNELVKARKKVDDACTEYLDKLKERLIKGDNRPEPIVPNLSRYYEFHSLGSGITNVSDVEGPPQKKAKVEVYGIPVYPSLISTRYAYMPDHSSKELNHAEHNITASPSLDPLDDPKFERSFRTENPGPSLFPGLFFAQRPPHMYHIHISKEYHRVRGDRLFLFIELVNEYRPTQGYVDGTGYFINFANGSSVEGAALHLRRSMKDKDLFDHPQPKISGLNNGQPFGPVGIELSEGHDEETSKFTAATKEEADATKTGQGNPSLPPEITPTAADNPTISSNDAISCGCLVA